MLNRFIIHVSLPALPLIEAYYGNQGLATGIIIGQLGSFLVLSTLGITVDGIDSRYVRHAQHDALISR